MKLTNKQNEILFNLIIQEQRNIHNMNANIQEKLEDYRIELGKIIQLLCDDMEDEENQKEVKNV